MGVRLPLAMGVLLKLKLFRGGEVDSKAVGDRIGSAGGGSGAGITGGGEYGLLPRTFKSGGDFL